MTKSIQKPNQFIQIALLVLQAPMITPNTRRKNMYIRIVTIELKKILAPISPII